MSNPHARSQSPARQSKRFVLLPEAERPRDEAPGTRISRYRLARVGAQPGLADPRAGRAAEFNHLRSTHD
jgi:hypothetical protein